MTTLATLLAVAALIPAQARADGWPTCAAWRARGLTAQACQCGAEVFRGDDRGRKACAADQNSSQPAPKGMAQGRGLASLQAKANGSRWFNWAEIVGGTGRTKDAGNGPGGGVVVGVYDRKWWGIDADYVTYAMRKPRVDVTDLGPVDPTDPTSGNAQDLAYTNTRITWNPRLGFNVHRTFGRFTPYLRAEGGYVGVPKRTMVGDRVIANVPGQPPIEVQPMQYSWQPTGEGNYASAAFGGGLAYRFWKRLSADVRVMKTPQFGVFPTGGLRLDLSRHRGDASKKANGSN